LEDVPLFDAVIVKEGVTVGVRDAVIVKEGVPVLDGVVVIVFVLVTVPVPVEVEVDVDVAVMESVGDTIPPKINSATNTPFKRFILQTQRMYFLNLHRVL